MIDFVRIFLPTAVSLAAPLMLAAMGGYLSERSGVINIALEGKMLMAACAAALAAASSGNAAVGLLVGIAAALLMSLAHWLFTQTYKLDHIVSGMALNLVAVGGSNFLNKRFTDLSATGQIPQLPLPVYYALAFGLPAILLVYATRTRPGLRMLAVGSDPGKSRQMGVDPLRVRMLGLIGTGVFTGLAGVLIVSNAGRFTDGMTGGKGYIALAALILGRWRPVPAAAAALLFGMFEALQIQFQGTALLGARLPSEFWLCIPYVVTIVAMAGLLGQSRAPAGLGKP